MSPAVSLYIYITSPFTQLHLCPAKDMPTPELITEDRYVVSYTKAHNGEHA
jgi:hypothetical protein